MIRFVEMKGIHLDDSKSFGFYNTVTDTFIGLADTFVFDSVEDFEMLYDESCDVDYDRLKSLIPKNWAQKKELQIGDKLLINTEELEDEEVTIIDLTSDGVPFCGGDNFEGWIPIFRFPNFDDK